MDNTNTVIKDEKSNIADMFTFALQLMIGDGSWAKPEYMYIYYTPCMLTV